MPPDAKPKTDAEMLAMLRGALKRYREGAPPNITQAAQQYARMGTEEAILFLAYQVQAMSQLLEFIVQKSGLGEGDAGFSINDEHSIEPDKGN